MRMARSHDSEFRIDLVRFTTTLAHCVDDSIETAYAATYSTMEYSLFGLLLSPLSQSKHKTLALSIQVANAGPKTDCIDFHRRVPKHEQGSPSDFSKSREDHILPYQDLPVLKLVDASRHEEV